MAPPRLRSPSPFKICDAERRVIVLGHVGLLESYFDETVDVGVDIAFVFGLALMPILTPRQIRLLPFATPGMIGVSGTDR